MNIAGSRFGLISDNTSDLNFVSSQSRERDSTVSAGGCTPEDAPDRAMGYDVLNAVVLAEGSERLRELQVKAIKDYVRLGGVIVFIGGAAQTAATDPRWASLLPMKSNRTRNSTINGASTTELIGDRVSDAVAVQNLRYGSAYSRSYGLGLIVQYTVNPFESPVKSFDQRRADVIRCLHSRHMRSVKGYLYTTAGLSFENENQYSGYAPSSTSYVSAPVSSAAPRTVITETDPFGIKAPPVTSIAYVLVAYFVVVLPLNFFILRRMKKLEMAWVTTPIISLIFSGVLLSSTVGLYRSTEVTKTRAVVVLAQGEGQGTVVGKSEMFFPRSQQYDLGLKGIDRIRSSSPNYYPRSKTTSGLNFIDTGAGVTCNDASTTNLAFREFGYQGSVDGLTGIKVTSKMDGDQVNVSVINQSKYDLRSVMVSTPAGDQQLSAQSQILSGQTKTLKFAIKPAPNGQAVATIGATTPLKVAVYGIVQGFRIGPSYGAQHPESTTYFYTTPTWERA
jgi:hypothetical protein